MDFYSQESNFYFPRDVTMLRETTQKIVSRELHLTAFISVDSGPSSFFTYICIYI